MSIVWVPLLNCQNSRLHQPGGPSLFVFLSPSHSLSLSLTFLPTITPPYTPVRPCYSPHPFSSVSFYPPDLTLYNSPLTVLAPCLSPYSPSSSHTFTSKHPWVSLHLSLSPFSSHKCTSLDLTHSLSLTLTHTHTTSPYYFSSPHPTTSHHLTLLPLCLSPPGSHPLTLYQPCLSIYLSLSPFSSNLHLSPSHPQAHTHAYITSPYSLSVSHPLARTTYTLSSLAVSLSLTLQLTHT
jgi:hypothetical protein